jgi:hypothetical protein
MNSPAGKKRTSVRLASLVISVVFVAVICLLFPMRKSVMSLFAEVQEEKPSPSVPATLKNDSSALPPVGLTQPSVHKSLLEQSGGGIQHDSPGDKAAVPPDTE